MDDINPDGSAFRFSSESFDQFNEFMASTFESNQVHNRVFQSQRCLGELPHHFYMVNSKVPSTMRKMRYLGCVISAQHHRHNKVPSTPRAA